MSERYLLGIDQGTTGTKAVLFDEGLHVLKQAYQPIHVKHPQSGWVEHDPEELVESVAATVAEVRPSNGEIVAAGLDNQGETIVAWDAESGKALAPAIVWQDKRSLELVQQLESSPAGTLIAKRSRLPLDPYFSASKMRWLLDRNPAIQLARERRTLVLGTSDVWLRRRLGASIATDASTASRTQLLDLVSGSWDAQLLQAFGLPPEAMARIEPTVGDLGRLSHPRWRQPIPLRASLVDQQAALAGHGCFSRGQIKATYGTGVFVLTNAGSDVPEVAGLVPTIAWQLDGKLTYALDGGIFAAGTVVDWLRDELGLFADAAETAGLATSVPDSAGVQFLPALAGLGAPWWRADATGTITGLRSSTRRAHVVRAALEGIAQRVADIVERVRETFDVSSISVDGGVTKNAFLLQYQADLLGVPVLRPSTTEATALGAAALAGIGAGLFTDLLALTRPLRPTEAALPQESSRWRQDQRAAWRQFVQRQTAELATSERVRS